MKIQEVPVKKDEEGELPIPTVWRPVFIEVVNAIVRKDYQLKSGVNNVSEVSTKTATQIKEYIDDYGEELIQLPSETWETSVYMWLDTHWEVLIDLWTIGEGPSDLVLGADVRERDGGYIFDIRLVYVP